EKLLFTGKEVFPFPKPHPFSRKAVYFGGAVFSLAVHKKAREFVLLRFIVVCCCVLLCVVMCCYVL
ncbi:MAG: hypothetical protein IKD29_09460, partial [Lentisphaeria bacterium]|nr:hypothetical protein [Lentisphaeria bacterium]